MDTEKRKAKQLEKAKLKKEKKKKKKNALVVCRTGREYWTTQAQFWQWIRERVIVKTGDSPLRGEFLRENEEYQVLINRTVLNLKHPNHLNEVLFARRKAHL